jgi:hypothetical protein
MCAKNFFKTRYLAVLSHKKFTFSIYLDKIWFRIYMSLASEKTAGSGTMFFLICGHIAPPRLKDDTKTENKRGKVSKRVGEKTNICVGSKYWLIPKQKNISFS